MRVEPSRTYVPSNRQYWKLYVVPEIVGESGVEISQAPGASVNVLETLN